MKDYYCLEVRFKERVSMIKKTFDDFKQLNEYVKTALKNFQKSTDAKIRDEAERASQSMPSLPVDVRENAEDEFLMASQ